MHESRHQHALRRARGCGGRFLNAKKKENEKQNEVAKKQENEQQNEVALGDKSQSDINLDADKNGIASSDGKSWYTGSNGVITFI